MVEEKEFHVMLRVQGQKNLSTVLSVLDGNATLVEVKEAQPAKDKPAHRYAGGKRNKGISAVDLVMECLTNAKRPVTLEEFSKEFVRRGFASGSASPILSELVRSQKVQNLGRGTYQLRGAK